MAGPDQHSADDAANPARAPAWSARLLDLIERIGNRFPDPATLFFIGALAVALLSQIAVSLEWSVTKTTVAQAALTGETVHAVSLLTADGLWWMLSHLISNFINFPPLGLVLVGMLGIGVAERTGLIAALLARFMAAAPRGLLTPAVVFFGVMSSLGLDAGYVVLPPLAAALFLAAGRSPLTGIAAAFAGVSAGFSANLLITAVDPLLTGFTESAAQVWDPAYRVAVTANWWFMIASTVLLTLVGWWVTDVLVERRMAGGAASVGTSAAAPPVDPRESRALLAAGLAAGLVLIVVLYAVWWPGAPLHGAGARFPRWVEATVPLLFLGFFVPGVVYGWVAGTIKNDRDLARLLGETMAGLGPYIVLAFFAAQFIEFFKYSRLGEMAAVVGGQWLAGSGVAPPLLVSGFALVVALANLFIGSASAKYAFFAPVFVPMLMQVGISPELTQTAYRVGDSVSNVITPFNPYMVIILALVQRYAKGSGLGTVVALMMPYALCFALAWGVLLLGWIALDLPLGPAGPLTYPPP